MPSTRYYSMLQKNSKNTYKMNEKQLKDTMYTLRLDKIQYIHIYTQSRGLFKEYKKRIDKCLQNKCKK